jgi:hypothetical protein
MIRSFITIFSFFTCSISYAQAPLNKISIPDTLVLELAAPRIINSLKELGEYEIEETLKKPFGYILHNEFSDYYVVIKQGGKWVCIDISTNRPSLLDSTSQINVNNKGTSELFVYVQSGYGHYDQFGKVSNFSDEIYIVDLDARKVLLKYCVRKEYELSSTRYIDSLGKEITLVDANKALIKIESNDSLTQMQKDSLWHAYKTYLLSLDHETRREFQKCDCHYCFVENRFIVDCFSMSKVPEERNFRRERVRFTYELKGDKWILLKNK